MSTLRKLIISYTEQAIIKNEWHKYLRLIQFVYNNAQHSTTGSTPFFLVHGRHPRTPLVDTKENHVFDHYKLPPQEFALKLQERLNCSFDLVDEIIVKPWNTEKVNPYKEGQTVLLFNQSLSTKNKPRKLMFDWIGPYNITEVKSKSTVNLKDIKNLKILFNVHIARIKPFKQVDACLNFYILSSIISLLFYFILYHFILLISISHCMQQSR